MYNISISIFKITKLYIIFKMKLPKNSTKIKPRYLTLEANPKKKKSNK